jgi:hypothetical protein
MSLYHRNDSTPNNNPKNTNNTNNTNTTNTDPYTVPDTLVESLRACRITDEQFGSEVIESMCVSECYPQQDTKVHIETETSNNNTTTIVNNNASQELCCSEGNQTHCIATTNCHDNTTTITNNSSNSMTQCPPPPTPTVTAMVRGITTNTNTNTCQTTTTNKNCDTTTTTTITATNNKSTSNTDNDHTTTTTNTNTNTPSVTVNALMEPLVPVLTLEPTSTPMGDISLGVGAETTLKWTVRNTGNCPCNVVAVGVETTNPFQIETDNGLVLLHAVPIKPDETVTLCLSLKSHANMNTMVYPLRFPMLDPETQTPLGEPLRANIRVVTKMDELLDRLAEMGFTNRDANKKLLKKYNMDIGVVTNDLLSRS